MISVKRSNKFSEQTLTVGELLEALKGFNLDSAFLVEWEGQHVCINKDNIDAMVVNTGTDSIESVVLDANGY